MAVLVSIIMAVDVVVSYDIIILAEPRQCRVPSAVACITVSVIALCLCITLAVLIWYIRIPVPHHSQTVLDNIVYLPFPSGIDQWLFNRVNVQLKEDSAIYPHEVTVCQSECPPKLQMKYYNLGKVWPCHTTRTFNCFAYVTSEHSSDDAQNVSVYMLRNSKVTFRITGSSRIPEPVQLCVSANKDSCLDVLQSRNWLQGELHRNCQQVLPFNKTNNYTRTVTFQDDGYFCAVWLLNSFNQWINYTSNLSVKEYNVTEFNSMYKCETETFPQSYMVPYSLHGFPKRHLCPVVQVKNGLNFAFGPNITVDTSPVKVLSDTVSVVLIVLFTLFLVTLTVSFVCSKVR